jgi:hypothetical protein
MNVSINNASEWNKRFKPGTTVYIKRMRLVQDGVMEAKTCKPAFSYSGGRFNGTGAVAIIGDGTAEYLTHLSMIESVLDNVSSGKKHEPAK